MSLVPNIAALLRQCPGVPRRGTRPHSKRVNQGDSNALASNSPTHEREHPARGS